MDFDYTTETITPDSTNILTIGGNGGLELPVGTTAQRPGSPANGLIRYNQDTNTVEGYFNNSWSSSFTPVANQITVQMAPGAGQFSSIAAACDSITTASDTNPYSIIIRPGIYIEPEINVPSYVQIRGNGQDAIVVKPLTGTQHLFNMSAKSSVSFITVEDVGTGFAAFNVSNAGYYSVFHKISVNDCYYGWLIDSTTADSMAYLEYCDTNGGYIGVAAYSSNGFGTYVNLENFYCFANEAGENPYHGIDLSGENTSINVQAFGLEGSDGMGHGLHIQDGSRADLKAGSVTGWEIGTHLSNTGTGPTVNLIGVAFHDNAMWDLLSEHPTAVGTLNGVARRTKVSAAASPLFTFAFSDNVDNAFVQTGAFYLGADSTQLSDQTALLLNTPPIGWLEGGDLTVDSGRILAVTAGNGYLHANGTPVKIEWAAGTIELPANIPSYIYVSSSGVLSTSPARPNELTAVLLGRALANATDIVVYAPQRFNTNHMGNVVDNYLRNAIEPLFGTGCIVSEGTSARTLDISAGLWYFSTNSYTPTGGTAVEFLDFYRVSGSPFYVPATLVDNTEYSGATDLVPITTGYYVKHSLYTGGSGASTAYFLVRAQQEYATLDEAISAPLPVPIYDTSDLAELAAIIVQEGNTNIVQIIDIRPKIGSAGSSTSGTTVHGDLTGLEADNHTQYLLVNGTRSMIGALNLGTNNITNVGTLNGITITAHGARHLPNGADPLTTDAAVTLTPTSTNTTGINNSLARSDHTHAITGFQPLDATLTSLAVYNTNGILTQTGLNTFEGRTLTGTLNRVSVVDGNGVAGNPTVDIDSAYTGQTSITTLGTITTGTWNSTAVSPTNGGTGLSAIGTSNQVMGVNAAGSALEYKTIAAGTGITVDHTANTITINTTSTGTVSSISGSGGTTGLTLSGGPITTSGTLTLGGVLVSGNGGTGLSTTPTNGQVLIGNGTGYTLSTLTGGTGISVVNGAGTVTINGTLGTVTSVAATQPAAGITISGSPVTSAGTLTFALANDLAAVEALATTGLATRTGTDTWAARTLTAPTEGFTITNPAGIAGNPTFALANDLLALENLASTGIAVRTGVSTWTNRVLTGTANQVLVTNGNGVAANPTVGLESNPIVPGTGSLTLPTGTTGQRPVTPVNGMTRYNSTLGAMEVYQSGNWVSYATSFGGSLVNFYTGVISPSSGTTVIPYDDTIPVSSEGTQIWSQTITPSATASRFVLRCSVTADNSANGQATIVSVFRGTTCIGSGLLVTGGNNAANRSYGPVSIQIVDTPATLSNVTYSMRAGRGGTFGTWYINSSDTGNNMGGTFSSNWTIEEIL